MTIDRDVDKVLQKTDAILTNAGYKELRADPDTAEEPSEDYSTASRAPNDGMKVSRNYVEFEVSDIGYDTGIPRGIKERPLA